MAKLRPLLKQQRLVVFVGSGISTIPPSKLPTWDGLTDSFVTFCEEMADSIGDAHFTKLVAHAPAAMKRNSLTTLTALRRALLKHFDEPMTGQGVRDHFRTWFIEQFAHRKPNAAHRAIVETGYPLIITSNYDDLLEKAALDAGFKNLFQHSITHNSAQHLAMLLYQRKSAIIHAHGKTADIVLNELVLTAEDYERYARDHSGFSAMLNSIFVQYSVLFVGYGASDPHFERMLEKLAAAVNYGEHPDMPQYYLLLEAEKADIITEEYKKAFRTHFIVVDSYKKDTLPFLRALKKAAPRPVEKKK